MPIGILSAPVVLPNGNQFIMAVSTGTWSNISVDYNKISVVRSVSGFDNTGTFIKTTGRVSTVASAVYATGNITFNLTEPIWQLDRDISITILSGAVTGSVDNTTSFSATGVSTSSLLPYPYHFGIHWIDPPHTYNTGVLTLRSFGAHPFGYACVDLGISRFTEVVCAGGIVGTFTWPEIVTFPAGSGILAPGTDLTGGGSKTVKLYLHSGVPVATDTISGIASSATAVVTSVTTGEVVHSIQTGLSTRYRDGNYGPASRQNCYQANLLPVQSGDYERWAIYYPNIGNIPVDTRNFPIRTTAATMDGDLCRGEWEINCDPLGLESGTIRRYRVDSTVSVNTLNTSGVFVPFEYCGVFTTGALLTVVKSVGNNASGIQDVGSFRFNTLPGTNTPRLITLSNTPSGGVPGYGDFIITSGVFGVSSTTAGFVLKYNDINKELSYIVLSNVEFSSTGICTVHDDSGFNKQISFVISAINTGIINTVIPSGATISGYGSNASCLAVSNPRNNGHDTLGSGVALAPYYSLIRCANKGGTDNGNSLADNIVIECNPGEYSQNYISAYETETRYKPITITAAPGIPKEFVRIVKASGGSNGLATNFQTFDNVLITQTTTTAGLTSLTSSTTIAGSYDRPAWTFKNCEISGLFRWSVSQVAQFAANTSNPFYIACINSKGQKVTIVSHLYRDMQFDKTAQDSFTLGRAIFNCGTNDQNATGTNLHSDVLQFQGTERGNCVVYGLEAKNLLFAQGAPFLNSSAGSATMAGFTFINMVQGEDYTNNLAQMGNTAAGTVLTLQDMFWLNCTTHDSWSWRSSAVGRDLKIVNLNVFNSFWTSYAKTEAGFISGIYPACFYNNHYAWVDPLRNGYIDTTGRSASGLFLESGLNNSPNFLFPNTGILINRSNYSNVPNSWPQYDVYGRKLSTNSTAKAAIGAVQPRPIMNVGYHTTNNITDGNNIGTNALRLGLNDGPVNLIITNTGPTGSLLTINTLAVTGVTIANILPLDLIAGSPTGSYNFSTTLSSSPATFGIFTSETAVTDNDGFRFDAMWTFKTLTGGGSVQCVTIDTQLLNGIGGVDITQQLDGIFDFDITGTSAGNAIVVILKKYGII